MKNSCLEKVERICREQHISRIALAMAYVKRESAISHLVFGVDSLEQLKQDIDLFQTNLSEGFLREMETVFQGIEAKIVMPSLWEKPETVSNGRVGVC